MQLTQKTSLVIGGTGGIGAAIINELLGRGDLVIATYHQSPPILSAGNVHWVQMDVTSERSIRAAFRQIQNISAHLDWVINAVGLLHTTSQRPEKALSQIDPDFFMQNMQINALASLLIAKALKPLFTKADKSEQNPAIFATISARVGSISDNQLGGWYSYRMSKAALNMGMKNLSLEWQRSLKNVCVVVLQPGTVDTSLSKPFQGGVSEDKLFSAEFSAKQLIAVLATLNASQSGSFLDWSGKSIAW